MVRSYYELLGVPEDASGEQIKKGYRAQVMKHHPDKGGSEAMFKSVTCAYEVLSDPEKRRVYDLRGEEGLRDYANSGGGAQPGPDPFDIFNAFFGGGRGGGFGFGGGAGAGKGKGKGPVRAKDVRHGLRLSLEEAYSGCVKRLNVGRQVVCDACKGTGSRTHAVETCKGCHGLGVRRSIRNLGPIVQEVRSPCQMCEGKGSRVPACDRCAACSASGRKREYKVVEVAFGPGVIGGDFFVCKGMTDEAPGVEAGDVLFVVQEISGHPRFDRKGEHLLYEAEVPLRDALCGGDFHFRHLDGRLIRVGFEGGVSPGEVRRIPHEGMPRKSCPARGDLYVKFRVTLPSGLDARVIEILRKELPGPSPPPPSPEDQIQGDAERCEMFKFSGSCPGFERLGRSD